MKQQVLTRLWLSSARDIPESSRFVMLSNFTLSSHSDGFTAPPGKQGFILGSRGAPGGLVPFHWPVGPGCKGMELQLWKARAMIKAKWLIRKLSLIVVLMGGQTEKRSKTPWFPVSAADSGQEAGSRECVSGQPSSSGQELDALASSLPQSSSSTEYVSPWDVAAGQGTIQK